MSMTIQSSVKDKILATSSETSKVENAPAEMLRDLDQQMEKRADDGKENVVTDALSRKEQVKPRRVLSEAMTIQYGVRGMILAAQKAAESVRDAIGFEYYLAILKADGQCRTRSGYAKSVALKGVIRFGKKGKVAPRYVGLFEILERVGPIAYRLRLPEELSGIKVDKTLCFVEEPVENSDREVKRLKCSRMVIVKVRFWLEARSLRLQAKWLAVRYLVKVSWNSKCNFELTWVWEDYLKDEFDNQSIERDRLIGIGFVLDFVEFISFTFGDKEMISVIEAVSR
ncbi:hypothetical protein Tco_0863410 [Tanacetum coccineum]